MSEVPIPFTSQNIDTDDDATGVAFTVGLLIVGFAIFAWARDTGGYVANWANRKLSSVIGVDPTSGEEAGADLV